MADKTITIDNRLDELARVERWLVELFADWSVPDAAAFAVDLVINEALANIISYGYDDSEVHPITIGISDEGDSLVVEIVDDARPFNPFDTDPVAAAADLEHATVGGRGIRLLRAYCSAHQYQYLAGQNHLRLTIAKQR
jgi:anti-sigma regulatory factor (Ser/Thr protein kinase)